MANDLKFSSRFISAGILKPMRGNRSKILQKGYINTYSVLNEKEKRQLYYNTLYKKLNPNWDNTLILLCKVFEEFLRLHPDSFKPVILDAGCGNGNYVIDEFRQRISLACGVDLNETFTAKNICLDEIRCSDLADIPYPNNTFDCALSLWVVEHLQNPIDVLKEINRVLKPGGYLIFCTPNKNNILLLLKRALKSGKLNQLINKVLYGRSKEDIFITYYKVNDINTISQVLKSTGFEVVSGCLNYDPGYTSFNKLSFRLSNFIDKTLGFLMPRLLKQHVVVAAKKRV